MDSPIASLYEPQAADESAAPAAAPVAEPGKIESPISSLYHPPTDRRSAEEVMYRGRSTGKDWADTKKQLEAEGYRPTAETGTQYEQGRALQAEKVKQGQGVSFADQAVRNLIPWGSSVINNRREVAYADATKRYQDGKASQEDYETIAAHDRRAAADQKINSTTAGQLLNIPLQAPAVIGEMYGGGKALSLGGKALGFGKTAAAAAAAGTPLAAPGLARTAINFAGKTALVTPLMPSTYLERANQINIEAGRDPNDVRGFPTALGLAYANNLVLGSLQKYGGGGNLLQQAAKKGAIGVGEQAAADVAAGGIDEFLPDAYKMKTRYGVLGDLARGDVSKGLGHATIQALTFSYFSALHGKSPDKITDAYKGAVDASAKAGLGPDAAAEKITSITDRLSDHLKQRVGQAAIDTYARDQEFYQEDAKSLFQNTDALTKGMTGEQQAAVKKYVDALIDIFPKRGENKGKNRPPVEANKTDVRIEDDAARHGDEGPVPEPKEQVSETTPEVKPPAEAALGPQGELIDVRSEIAAHGGEANAAGDAIKARVAAHLAAGGEASVWHDGKEHPIGKVENGRIIDRKGQSWGTTALAFGVAGKKTGIELKGGPTPSETKAAGPGWLSNNMDAHFDTAKRAGVVDRIVELASQGKVAKEIAADIADKLPADADPLTRGAIVAAVRSRFKIPSANEPAELAKWNADRAATKPPETKPAVATDAEVAAKLKQSEAWVGKNPNHPLVKALRGRAATRDVDPITGYGRASERNVASEEALASSRRGERRSYVDMDIANTKGVGDAVGDSRLRGHIAAMMKIVENQLRADGHDPKMFRQGMDARADEFAAVVKGDQKGVEASLEKAKAKIAEYTKLHKLNEIAHTKEGKAPGTGVNTGVAEFKAGKSAQATFAEAESGTGAKPLPKPSETNGPHPEVVKAAHEIGGPESVKNVEALHEELNNGTGDLSEATKAAADAKKELDDARTKAVSDLSRGSDGPGGEAAEPHGDRGGGLAAEAESSGVQLASGIADRTRDQAAAKPRKPRQAKGEAVKKEPKPAKKPKAEPKPVKPAKGKPADAVERVKAANAAYEAARAEAEPIFKKHHDLKDKVQRAAMERALSLLDHKIETANDERKAALEALADQNGSEFAVHVVDGPGAEPREVERHTSLERANQASRRIADKETRGQVEQSTGKDIKNELGEKLHADGRPNSAQRHYGPNGKQVYVSRVDRAPKPAPESARKSPVKKEPKPVRKAEQKPDLAEAAPEVKTAPEPESSPKPPAPAPTRPSDGPPDIVKRDARRRALRDLASKLTDAEDQGDTKAAASITREIKLLGGTLWGKVGAKFTDTRGARAQFKLLGGFEPKKGHSGNISKSAIIAHDGGPQDDPFVVRQGAAKAVNHATIQAAKDKAKKPLDRLILANYIRGYGGIDAKSLSKDQVAQLRENGLMHVMQDDRGQPGTNAIDTLADHLRREGHLEQTDRKSPEDQLIEALQKGKVLEHSEAKQGHELQEHWKQKQAEAEANGDTETFDPNVEIPFSRGGPAGGTESHRLVAEQNKLFGNPNYVENGVPGAPSDVNAAARLQERATVTRKLSAGDAEVNLEEHAHHLQRQYGLPTDPAALPSAVARGIQAFFSYRAKNYGVSETTPSRTGMIEGFADWLIARSKGGLTGLSPAQEVANKYLEKWAADKGLTEKFDKLKELYKDFHGQTPEAKAAGLVSSTGQPEAPPKTIKEAAQDLANKAQDNIDDSLAVLNRIGADAEANGAPKGLAKRVKAIWSQLMYADPHRAAEFERDGVHTYEDGRKRVIGLPFEKIIEGAKPEWLQPGENGGASRAGVYALARHLLGEEARGETDRVSKEQLEVYRAAFEEMGKDKGFSDWAKGFAERLTAANNASLDALAGEGVKYYSKDQVDAMKKKYPDYAELSRVMQDAGWKTGGGARGAGPKTMTGERSGSGEQIVDPLISYKNRLRATSAVMGEQLRFLETRKFAPYVGNWMLSSGVEQRTKLGDVRAEVLEKLGFKGTALENTLKAMGADRAEDYFRNAPWPVDGTKPTYTRMYDGKPESYRVGNRDFYNLITGQQTDASATASWMRATAKFLPIKWMTQAVKFGATSASLGFQFRNVPRDIYTFYANTVDRAGATPGAMADAYKRAFAYSWHQLTNHFDGAPSQDALYKRFAADRGLDQRQFTFEKDNPASAYAPSETKGIKEAHTVWGILKDVLNLAGAGENAPRFLEWKNRILKTTGKTEAELTKELEAAEAAQKAGKPIADPIPFAEGMDGMEHAAEVTVNFNRLGTVTREVNKITPFFGPAIAGLSKSVRNWKENPKGAAFAMSGLLAARLLHWAMFSDEDWYKELNSNDRYNNFVVPTPAGLRRLPAPRDLEVAGGGLLIASLDAASRKNPDFKGLLRESLGAVAPPAPVPPAAKTGYEIARNENWMGSPIVPKRDENKSVQDKWTEDRAPYAADQLTGGLLSARKIPSEAKDLIPYSEVKNARRSVDDFYERFHDMEEQRNKALKQGKRFEQEAEYHRLNAAQEQIVTLGRAVRGDRMVNGRVIKGEPPTPEKVQELRAKQIQVARKALGTE